MLWAFVEYLVPLPSCCCCFLLAFWWLPSSERDTTVSLPQVFWDCDNSCWKQIGADARGDEHGTSSGHASDSWHQAVAPLQRQESSASHVGGHRAEPETQDRPMMDLRSVMDTFSHSVLTIRDDIGQNNANVACLLQTSRESLDVRAMPQALPGPPTGEARTPSAASLLSAAHSAPPTPISCTSNNAVPGKFHNTLFSECYWLRS